MSRFTGHAAVWDEPALIAGEFWERVAPGAFRRALAERQDVRLLVDHDPSRLLARTRSGTLRLAEDRMGLRVDAELADTTVGRDVGVLLARGDLSQMSFGFTVAKERWERARGGRDVRVVEEVARLFDVSVVTFPAYELTSARLLSDEEAAGAQRGELRRRLMRARLDALRPDPPPPPGVVLARRRLEGLRRSW